jgi:signal transduction histidine kinase
VSTINNKIQQLEEQLLKANDPTSGIDLLNCLAYEARHTDTALTLQKSVEAIARAEAIGYQKGLASGYLNKGFAEMVLANYGAALQTLNKAFQIFDTLEDKLGKAHALYNLGLVYRNIGDFNQALESYQQSFALRQSLGDEAGEAACLMQLGYLFFQFGNVDEADKHYSRSLAIGRKVNDRAGIAASLLGIGIIKQKRQLQAEAEVHLLESLLIREEIGEVHGCLVSKHYLGEFYLGQHKLEEAEKYLVNALDQARLHANPFPANFCRLCTSLAKVYIGYRKFDQAIDYLEEGLSTAKEANLKYLLYDLHLTLSDVYKQSGDYKQALASYEQYHLCREEMINLSAGTKLKNLELTNQIEAERREAEIHRLRHVELKEAYDQLKQTQTQLIQSEKMASLGELTAGIAHEIQNPLNFVNNFADLTLELAGELKEGAFLHLPDEVREEAEEILKDLEHNLQKIHHHGQRADSIVKNMLLHSRTSLGEKQLTNINALADEYLRLSYHGFRAKDKSFNATLSTHFDEQLGKVNVLQQELGRVLLNLYHNAFYAIQQKLKAADKGYRPEVSISTSLRDDFVEIKLRDNGIGIPQSNINKIFQPFFTTKPTGQGTGLGLSLSYDIISKSHMGELAVESEEGEFTEFIIRLPLE